MKVIAIIPARMGSSRFPGKPLKKIHGMPMIGHCYLRARMCQDLYATYVATCDQEIYDYIKSINGNVVMTSTSHEMASDRAAEAMIKIEKEIKKISVIINIISNIIKQRKILI